MRKTNIAIITGASSGLGKEFVRLLVDKKAFDEIWVIARNKNNLDLLVSKFGNKIKPYSMDLSNIENIKNFEKEIKIKNVNVCMLINNAGFAKFGKYDDISLDESINMINLNISGVVAMTLACIPYMKKGSYIMNVSSQASFQPLPYMNIYGATKSFVKNYSRALSAELKDKNIHVMALCSGWITTNLFDRANIGAKKNITNFYGIKTPDVIAKKALNDLVNKKDVSIYGAYVNTYHCISKIIPENILMKIWLMQQKI